MSRGLKTATREYSEVRPRLKRVEDLLQTKNHKWFVLNRAGKKSEKSPADRAGHRASRAKGEMFEVDIGTVTMEISHVCGASRQRP